MNSVIDLFEVYLQVAYDMESQLVENLPRLIDTFSNSEIHDTVSDHLEDTQAQLDRLTQIGETEHLNVTGESSVVMASLLDAGDTLMSDISDAGLVDVALVSACASVEYYEISVYTTLIELAQRLDLDDSTIDELKTSLKEEQAAAKKMDAAFSGLVKTEVKKEE